MNDALATSAIAYLLLGLLFGTFRPDEQNWQSRPESVKRMAQMMGMACTAVPVAGHLLGKRYVASVPDRCASA